MARPKGTGTRVQAVLDDDMIKKIIRIKEDNNLESYPQTVRLIIKYFDEEAFKNRNKHLTQTEE